ncbi:PHD-zinc-finger like domain-containing protein [Halteromyces radiatus]|uniref:PHD-zinc-finger like domain-containing protein n=1 Tax=Halteromyces radiatus TaxID=101107 RepID=UPI00221E6885|nr:PHD-zinc-finger like domain-containing protein [Halteromyces radiatus]KAI8096646.1 PHD-zinc-finger like domain-containing protein [Halteromyces radiatus]
MPYKPRGRGGRRGRPPKRHSISPAQKHGLSYTGDEARSASAYSSGLTISLKATQDTQPYSSTLTTPTSATYKPREERSYKDFFPDLNIKQPLIIVRHHQNSITDSTMTHPTTTTTTTSLAMNNTSPSTPQPPPSSTSSNSEPTEEELFDMVEYDMDEQDETWLQMLNAERRKDDLGEVSCSFFENVIDKLEKEWFDLVKNLPKQVNDEPSLPEDSSCAICDDGECENSNAIVFCDGCNLAVHQDCYGVPYIPEGQWLCRKCMVSPDKPVTCLFCPNEGGAFKQTNTNKWGHLLCAIWIPEVGVSNSVYMEPIDNIDSIPKSRWKLTCYICRKRHGACIQCDNKHCFTAFHVTCARWARLCMRMKSHGSHYDSVLLKAYCDRHTPRDYREEVDVEKCVLAAQKFLDPKSAKNRGRSTSSYTPRRRYVDEFLLENGEEDGHFSQDDNDDFGDDDDDDDQKQKQDQVMPVAQLTPSLKAARAHQHHYSAGAPIAPDYILTRLEQIKLVRQATHLKKRSQLIASICRYWSLKRESRRGAPLLKRLHLEPWTASSSQLKQTEVEKAHKASAMMSLRADLEVVRMLSEQVQKREKQKLERIRRQKEYVEMVLFPVEYIVKPILNQLME